MIDREAAGTETRPKTRTAESLARTRLIETHLGLVDRIAGRYAGGGERREDLVQVGALALVGAVDRCDRDRAAFLPAYAARCVEGEILRHLRDRSAPVRVPRRLQEFDVRARRAGEALERRLGREPTTGEVADAAGLEEADVRATRAVASARRPLPLSDAEVGSDDIEVLGLERALVARAARALDDDERRVVLLRYFLDLSQDEIAAEIEMSQAHVSRLLRRAAGKMRRRLEASPTL